VIDFRAVGGATGIEPVTPNPLLASKSGNAMWLILLAFTYVM
jgi:hypothetical protein